MKVQFFCLPFLLIGLAFAIGGVAPAPIMGQSSVNDNFITDQAPLPLAARQLAGQVDGPQATPHGDTMAYGLATTSTICPDFFDPPDVGVEDIQAFAARWRQRSTDPGWEARFDLDGDGDTDIGDIMPVAAAWGRTCPFNEARIPNIEFPDPPPEDIVAPDGIPISIHDLIVIFSDIATVEQVNALLQSLPAQIVGGNPLGKVLLIRLAGDSDLNRVLDAQQTLLSHPLVMSASINFALEDERLPPHNVDAGNNRWTWEVPLNAGSGNWGLKTIRMPQAWNLYDYVVRQNATIDVLIMDASATAASAAHPDLAPRIDKFRATDPEGDHDTVIAGIIGAIWDNNSGVEGIYPRNLAIVSRWRGYWGGLADTTVRVLNAWSNVRVVSYSAGESETYRANGIDPVTDLVNPANPASPTWRVEMDNAGNGFLAALQAFATGPGGRTNFLMFCSAGNLRLRPGTALDYEARDNSPCANVAVRGVAGAGAGADHFLAVESMDSGGNRSTFSASAGTVSAPGTCVRSTEFNDGTNYPSACPGDDADDQEYATNSGTSFATPHAAGLAAYLWSLDSTLRYDQVRQAITDPANTVAVGVGAGGGTAAGNPRVDAFAAAMGIDVIRANRDLQRALVNVDDGTRDGNQRTERDDFNQETGRYTSVDTGDGRRGDEGVLVDRRVSMRDFRALRDAATQILAPPGMMLDGGDTHFKKDLNFDGCVGNQPANPAHPGGTVPVPPDPLPPDPPGCANAPGEDVYPRYDFNGDGRVNNAPAPFKGNNWMDLQVLTDFWPADTDLNEHWLAADLDLLMPWGGGSGDIEFRTRLPLGPAADLDEIRITMNMNGRDETRKLTPDQSRLVWTMPAGVTHPVTAEGFKGGQKQLDLCVGPKNEISPLRQAEDRVVLVTACPSLLFHRTQGLVIYDIQQKQELTIQPQGYFWRGYCYSPDGSHILASKWRDTSWDLVWMALDGYFVVVASDPNVDEVEPRCPRNTDGTRYFYISETRDANQTLLASDIYRLDYNPVANTWQSTNLTNDADLQHYTYDVKPDGTEVAYTLYSPNATSSPCPLYAMNFDGTNRRRLLYGGLEGVFMGGCPAPMHINWSRDSSKIHIGDPGVRYRTEGPPENPIIYEDNFFLYVSPAGETGYFMVTVITSPTLDWPQFSPPWNDRTFTAAPGGGIVFSNFACESNPPWRGVFTVTGTGWQALHADLCGYEYDYSADGGLLAFTPLGSPVGGIWLMASNGTSAELISNDGERPIFSP